MALLRLDDNQWAGVYGMAGAVVRRRRTAEQRRESDAEWARTERVWMETEMANLARLARRELVGSED